MDFVVPMFITSAILWTSIAVMQRKNAKERFLRWMMCGTIMTILTGVLGIIGLATGEANPAFWWGLVALGIINTGLALVSLRAYALICQRKEAAAAIELARERLRKKSASK